MYTCAKAGRKNIHNENHGCINYGPCGYVLFIMKKIAGVITELRCVTTAGRTRAFGSGVAINIVNH